MELPLHQAVSAKMELWKRIIPVARKEQLCQTFLVHGKSINLNLGYACFQMVQTFQISPVLHIAESNIRAAAASYFHHFHAEFRGTDPAPKQGSIKNQSFHKTVSGPRRVRSFWGSDTFRAG